MSIRLSFFLLAASMVGFAIGQDGNALSSPSAEIEDATAELASFIAKEEPDFSWSLVEKRQVKKTTVYQLKLTSQRWQDKLWQHDLMVFEPANVIHQQHMLLYIAGGSNQKSPGNDEVAMGASLATLCGARVAMLHQVPNQPLMGNRFEDDLITETWLRYLETGDTTWPLLFPMVKSSTRAMDALQEFAESNQWQPIEGFVTAGASKRGWTSWLTPAADSRVIATAPMVIDMLNFPVQIKHQYEMWGGPSEQIHDYTSKNLIRKDGVPRTPRETKLWQMMDPYSYRNRVKIPKLLIVGANDPYWTTDAMNQYWDDLEGPKSIFRGANAGHGLQGKRDEAISTLAVFFRHATVGKPLPELEWTSAIQNDSIGLEVSSDQTPTLARMWVATSDSMDFRTSTFRETAMQKTSEGWSQTQAIPANQHVAVFAEFVFDYEGLPFMLSTLAYCK